MYSWAQEIHSHRQAEKRNAVCNTVQTQQDTRYKIKRQLITTRIIFSQPLFYIFPTKLKQMQTGVRMRERSDKKIKEITGQKYIKKLTKGREDPSK